MEILSHNLRFLFLARLLCVLVIVGLFNVHIALYQGYAWITMLNDRIPEQGIENALTTTFSGDLPCEKCIAIAAQRAKEQREEPVMVSKHHSEILLICSAWKKVNVYPHVGNWLGYSSPVNFPLEDVALPVISPPPQFV